MPPKLLRLPPKQPSIVPRAPSFHPRDPPRIYVCMIELWFLKSNVIKNVFSRCGAKFKSILPKLDNLDCFGIMFNLILSHAYIRHHAALVKEKYPIKFINTLRCFELELCFDVQITQLKIEATPSPYVAALLIIKCKSWQTNGICFQKTHGSMKEPFLRCAVNFGLLFAESKRQLTFVNSIIDF